MKRLALALLLVASPASAEVSLSGRVEQGGLAIGQARPGSTVTLDGKPVPVAPDGRFLIGFGRDAPAEAVLTVDGQEQRLTVGQRDWIEQRIDGLPEKQVSPPPEIVERIRAENAQIAQVRQRDTRQPWFAEGLLRPADGPVSSVFGSRRVLNGEPRAAHSGTDIAAPQGAPVRAAGRGVVSMVADHYLTGHSVMIDHGYGLQTIYVHLASVAVRDGQAVGKGQMIGTVGATGRATGPHLHFGASLYDIKLDPEVVLGVLGQP